jgi:quinol monooxygenase YgiN
MNIHVVALMKFKENHLFDAIELLKKLVSETRKEEGCLQYDLIEDKENKGHFFMVELWETEEHLHKHSVQDHILEFRKNAIPMMESQNLVYKGMKIF